MFNNRLWIPFQQDRAQASTHSSIPDLTLARTDENAKARQSSENTFGFREERNKVYCKQVKEFTVDKNQKTIKGAKTLRLFLVDF